MERPHSARYLILCGPSSAQRALLFNQQLQYLAEIFDDGLMVDALLQSGTRCPVPSSLPLNAVLAPDEQAGAAEVKCFALH